MLAVMTRTRACPVILAAALLAAWSTAGACAASGSGAAVNARTTGEQEQVRAAFYRFAEAVGDGKGEAAARVVSERTFAYFERMRLAALQMPAAEVKLAPLMDRMTILQIRAEVCREDLERWRGRELFVQAMDRGWVQPEAVLQTDPDAVTIEGDAASLGLRNGAWAIAPADGLRLYREAGTWKLDVASVLRSDGEPATQRRKLLQRLDPDPNLALVKLVAATTGRPVGPQIWEALRPPK
jgi:hypothetical protein